MSTVFLVARFKIEHPRKKSPACSGNLLLHRISCAVTLNYNNTALGQKQVFFLQNFAILKKILPQFCHPSCRVFPSGFWRGNLPFQGLFAVIWGGFSFLLRKYPLSYKFLRFALVGTRIDFCRQRARSAAKRRLSAFFLYRKKLFSFFLSHMSTFPSCITHTNTIIIIFWYNFQRIQQRIHQEIFKSF